MHDAFVLCEAFDAADARDNREFVNTKLKKPVLVITGDKAMGPALEVQAKLAAENVTAFMFANTGYWLMSECPTETMAALTKFFDI